ncbi:MAG: hypothetical protein HZA93_09445 [Verrucomicrobia bacterium]|nr:hypothetical protein [Verrucomicrobiota bacterium]
MNRDSRRPVTLEDLLQLKRAERPAPEFWTTFERDLRAKQLAALVEKRPWWQSLPRVFAGFSRYHLPIGAAAIAVLTLFTVREYRSAALPAAEAGRSPTVVAATASVGPSPAVVTVAPLAAAPAPVVESKLVESADALTVADDSQAAPLRVVPVVALLSDSVTDNSSPSARTIAANRAMAQAVDPELANRFLNTARGFEARVMPARQPAVEPLAQVSLSEARRARQFIGALPVAFNHSTGSSEKVARKISDERLYDTVSRFGASGDRVKIKF